MTLCRLLGHAWHIVNRKLRLAQCTRCGVTGWDPKLEKP